MKKQLSALLALGLSLAATARAGQEYHAVIIPGQNKLGGQYAKPVIFNNTSPAIAGFHAVKTPLPPVAFPDLGQAVCQKPLQQTMTQLLKNPNLEGVIIHASSQGTATAVNYVAKNPEKISALILEAVLASGNSAIHHTVENIIPCSTKPASSYNWLPSTARVVGSMPWYSPSGEQPIFSVQHIPNTIPVIIIHAVDDPQLSIHDAEALYVALRSQGNNEAYLIRLPRYQHIDLVDRSSLQELAVIHAVLKKNNLPHNPSHFLWATVDLADYQPDPNDPLLQKAYTDLVDREENLRACADSAPSSCSFQ